ncbi:DsrE family protein [Sphingobacterium sp.]|uniref:DsrE family protein n=1 Tax=Sphingobacterium sp. TaxID=341027 RepID=UPI0028ADD2CB|nr:DsrE family protein [Sphingobacterium sp.]
MKRQFLILALILITSFTFSFVQAQEKTPVQIENSIKKNGKYAFLAQSSRHFIAGVETGERFIIKSKKIKFEIVLAGPVVKDLSSDKELKSYADMAEKAGIKIVICENSMAHLGVEKSSLPMSVLTTTYGFTYFLGLQENGFKTIQL